MGNFLIMASHVAIFGLLAIGMLLVILNGGIDLSVGSVLDLSGVFADWLMQGVEVSGSRQTVFTVAVVVLAVLLNSIQYGRARGR